MTASYPPTPKHPTEIELMTLVYTSVVEGRGACYVSAPITSGKRLLAWRVNATKHEAQPTYWEEHREAVAKPNRAAAQIEVRALRQRFRMPVIDPTAVPDLPGWTQDDFRAFWAKVIERYVGMVVLLDGWESSSGCAYEFLVAQRAAVRCLTRDLEDLSLETGLALIQRAIDDYNTANLPAGILEPIARDLECLVRTREERHEHSQLAGGEPENRRAGGPAAAVQGRRP